MLFRSENAWSVKENVIAKTWIRMITIKPVTYVAHPGTASDVKRRIKRHSASTARARTENAPVATSKRTAISSEWTANALRP
jgi:hypothetical protein